MDKDLDELIKSLEAVLDDVKSLAQGERSKLSAVNKAILTVNITRLQTLRMELESAGDRVG